MDLNVLDNILLSSTQTPTPMLHTFGGKKSNLWGKKFAGILSITQMTDVLMFWTGAVTLEANPVVLNHDRRNNLDTIANTIEQQQRIAACGRES
jgi:hypothetical protein